MFAPFVLRTGKHGASAQALGKGRKVRSDDPALIEPGRSVGLLKIGDTRRDALRLFPPKPRVDQEYEYDNRANCGTQFNWVSLDPMRYGANMSIQFKDGLVSQIGSMLPVYHTAEGINVDSKPELLRRYFRSLRAYVLFGTASRAVGDRPLTFWVDWDKGISFSFAYDWRREERTIWEITVFDPKASLCPEGQTAAAPDWQELPPYTLEPSREMERRWVGGYGKKRR